MLNSLMAEHEYTLRLTKLPTPQGATYNTVHVQANVIVKIHARSLYKKERKYNSTYCLTLGCHYTHIICEHNLSSSLAVEYVPMVQIAVVAPP